MKKFYINQRCIIADSVEEAVSMSKAISEDENSEKEVDLQYLIDDEIEAIAGYRKMIAKCTNPALLAVLSHILKEESEHVEELRNAQAGIFKVEE